MVEMAEAKLFATFTSRVRGVRFYDVPSSTLTAGPSAVLQLEPTNPYDANCVAVFLRSIFFWDKLGHLAREDAVSVARLLRSGLHATG